MPGVNDEGQFPPPTPESQETLKERRMKISDIEEAIKSEGAKNVRIEPDGSVKVRYLDVELEKAQVQIEFLKQKLTQAEAERDGLRVRNIQQIESVKRAVEALEGAYRIVAPGGYQVTAKQIKEALSDLRKEWGL